MSFKYYRYASPPPSFDAGESRIKSAPPSPSIFRVESPDGKHFDWCIWRRENVFVSGDRILKEHTYHVMERTPHGWKYNHSQSSPLAGDLLRINNGWKVPVEGELIIDEQGTLRIA